MIRLSLIRAKCLGLACLLSLGISASGVAQTGISVVDDEPITTQHTISIHGELLSYKARAGYLSLRDQQNRSHGRMFFVSNIVDHGPSDPDRPIIFVWNGGPGSNAALLELGILGPKRIPDRSLTSTPSGTELVDNENTWLKFADLVFVDPIYTGYSYATSPHYQNEFLSDDGDADAMAEFIRLYLPHYEAQIQPVFLVGESYGTYRAVGVADILIHRKIPVKGVILLSTILNLETNPDLAQAFLLPSYAAAAFAQKKLTGKLAINLEQTINEVRDWSEGPYLEALVQGDRLLDRDKAAVAHQLAIYSGVPSEEWIKHNLRLSPDQFAVAVLGLGGTKYVGHYDTRMVGSMPSADANYVVDQDPSLDNGEKNRIVPYLRSDLGWKSDMLYAGPFGGRWPSPHTPNGDWTAMLWNRGSSDRANLVANALQAEPALCILIVSGEFDLATPFATAEYSIDHLFLPASERSRVKFIRYPGGHAAYVDASVRTQFSRDAAAFVRVSSPRQPN
jgi:carboxypeptidase C (cathepsin A)